MKPNVLPHHELEYRLNLYASGQR